MKETKTYCDRCYRTSKRRVEAHAICVKCGQDICSRCAKLLVDRFYVCEYCAEDEDIKKVKNDLSVILDKLATLESNLKKDNETF